MAHNFSSYCDFYKKWLRAFTLQSEGEFFAGAAKRVREFREGHRAKAVARENFESLMSGSLMYQPRRIHAPPQIQAELRCPVNIAWHCGT